MIKPLCVVSCPIDTYSGYGARSRDFVKSLIALKKYDVKILSQRWGNTRFGYLEDHKEVNLQSRVISAQMQQHKNDVGRIFSFVTFENNHFIQW